MRLPLHGGELAEASEMGDRWESVAIRLTNLACLSQGLKLLNQIIGLVWRRRFSSDFCCVLSCLALQAPSF